MSKAGAKAVAQVVRKLVVPAGKASPSPPVGPAMGARGVKAMDFCKEFNARTAHLLPETPTPCSVTIQPDRTFTFEIRTPPTTYLLKKAAGIDKGSGSVGNGPISGKVNLKQVYEIAKVKCRDADLAAVGEEAVSKQIIGTARSLGLEVVA